MKKAKFKKRITSIISVISVFSILTACSGEKTESTSTKETTTQKVEKGDPFGKYSEPITVSYVTGLDVAQDTFLPGEDLKNNRWTKAYEDELGIKLKLNWSTSSSQLAQKINLDIASNNIPDIMAVNLQQFKQLLQNDMIADLTDVYDAYISPEAKAMIESDGGINKSRVTIDGKLMGITAAIDPTPMANIIWIRNDWLKSSGLSAPKTQEDVIKIAKAFAKNDPDGNGKADTYGLGFTKDLSSHYLFDLDGFTNAYHAYPNQWVKDSKGKLVYGSTTKEMKTALEELQTLYKEGVIDQEFSVTDQNKMIEQITGNKVGMFYGKFFAPAFPLSIAMGMNPSADWRPYPIVSSDDEPAKASVEQSNITVYVVSKNAKRPEAAIKMANLFAKLTNEQPAKYQTGEKGTLFWTYAPINFQKAFTSIQSLKDINTAIETGDTSKLNMADMAAANGVKEYAANKDPKNWGTAVMSAYGKVTGLDWGSSEIIEYYNENDLLQYEAYLGIPSDEMSAKQANMDKLQIETFTKIIMGAAPISEFDKFVEQWKKLGGDDATKEVNEWASKQK